MSHVFLRKVVPMISLCQDINTLIHTKDILRVSACQNESIMTPVINVRHLMTPMSLMSDVP